MMLSADSEAAHDEGRLGEVCDRLLSGLKSQIGAPSSPQAVYQRAEFLAERKGALEAWAGHVAI